MNNWNSNAIYALVTITFGVTSSGGSTTANWPTVPLFAYDRIQINNQGPWYTIASSGLNTYSSPTSLGSTIPMNTFNATTQAVVPLSNPPNAPVGTSTLLAYVDLSLGQQCACFAPPYFVAGPYGIIRYHNKSVASPLQLPAPACIDLTWSGIDDPTNLNPTWGVYDNNPVTIMFAPTGAVDKIYATVPSTAGPTYNEARVTAPIYLLVGRRDEVVDPVSPANTPDPTNTTSNVYDMNALWVAINANTGLIIVTDNMQCSPLPPPTLPPPASPTSATCQQSRTFARQSDAMGGK